MLTINIIQKRQTEMHLPIIKAETLYKIDSASN